MPNIFRSLRPGLSSLSPGPPAGSAARSPCSRCPFRPTLLLAAPRFLDVTPVHFCHVSVSASCVSCPAAPSLGHQGQSAPSTAGQCPTESSHGHFPSWPWNPPTAYTYACHVAPECGRTLLANFLAFSFFPFFFSNVITSLLHFVGGILKGPAPASLLLERPRHARGGFGWTPAAPTGDSWAVVAVTGVWALLDSFGGCTPEP